jgi:Flp pilus assembly protein TadG
MVWMAQIIHFFNFKSYLNNESGVSALEAAILFPVLFSMLMAIYDLGQGIVINQKTVSASQVIADLISRNEVVDIDLIDDIVIGGRLALEPYNTAPFGYDIASIEFDEDGDPIILWRVTNNMDENDNAVDSTIGLGEEGEGVIAVSVVYAYEPFFTDFIIDSFDMMEVAFLRGRKSTTVTCSDCP